MLHMVMSHPLALMFILLWHLHIMFQLQLLMQLLKFRGLNIHVPLSTNSGALIMSDQTASDAI
jgi:hypothetical protein